jgi:hypothetical protein
MSELGRLWRTVRHLKHQQIIGRALFHVRRPRPDLRPALPLRQRCGTWVAPARREQSLISSLRLRLLNNELDLRECGWDEPRIDRLWRYNAHYFDDLNARNARNRTQQQVELVESWLRCNPPGTGTGWEPYPVSLRIVNWIKWFLSGMRHEQTWVQSLAVQARWLSERVETHLLGNHLFANAKALLYAGLFFEGEEAGQWRERGSSLLSRELDEQVLEDGGHFERSPMYHALALEDVLDLLNVLAVYGAHDGAEPSLIAALRARAGRILYWLLCMSHPDGTLGAFNDSAGGVAPSIEELERYAAEFGIHAPAPAVEPCVHLQASGYVRLACGPALALLDVAPLGPDYLPAHAHADTLSFELSLGRRRVIVNGGTSCYGTDRQRQAERGTAAHSTVEVAQTDSSEVWSGFRVGRRARPHGLQIDGTRVCCSHDGYRFLAGRPEHRRCWQLDSGGLRVTDRLVGGVGLPAIARYILAPQLGLQIQGDSSWEVLDESRDVVARVQVLQGRGSAVSAQHAPRFGERVQVACLQVDLIDGNAATHWQWQEHAHGS